MGARLVMGRPGAWDPEGVPGAGAASAGIYNEVPCSPPPNLYSCSLDWAAQTRGEVERDSTKPYFLPS